MIWGNVVGGSSGIENTYVIEDIDGNQYTGVSVDKYTLFTATDNDVREGAVYASDGGISTGTKFIPPYYVRCGYKYVSAGKEANISCPEYDYQNIIVTIATYNTNWQQSTILKYVSIDNSLYNVVDNTKVSDITVDYENERINLGITVNEKSVLRYFIVREEE